MSTTICFDFGNTRLKAAIFKGTHFEKLELLENDPLSAVQNLLDKYKIVLDMNVINDHHTLGIIDNFAKRIKTFFTLKFLRTKSENWINLLSDFIKNYNNSEHKALDYLTPNDALLPENLMKIEQMNLIKNNKIKQFQI